MLAEEMRLLYVAMTRAKSKLIFTGVFDAEKKLSSMNEVIKDSSWLLPSSHRLSAKNYADWVIPAVLKHPDTKELVETYCEAQPLFLSDESSWKLRIISEHEQLEEQQIEKEIDDEQPPMIDFEKVFYQSYDYQPLVEINAKQSVSQRKEEESTPMFKGIPEVKPQVAYDRPSFMKENQVSGPEAGTALHQFMQHLPVTLDHTLESLQEMKTRVIEKEMMTEAMANKIDLEQVLAFIKTPLYETLTKAFQIKKEVPFMTLVKVSEHEQSQILLQGVIDLLAEFDDHVWIIDYKTDYVRDFNTQYEELKERYAVQMKYYSKAIKEIYPTKKVSCYVYFLKVQQSIIYE